MFLFLIRALSSQILGFQFQFGMMLLLNQPCVDSIALNEGYNTNIE